MLVRQGELDCHQKDFKLPFLILKVRLPATKLEYNNEFKSVTENAARCTLLERPLTGSYLAYV